MENKFCSMWVQLRLAVLNIRHVVHKHELHELTLTRTLSLASGLFEFINFCLPGMLANIHEYFKCCH